MEQKKLKILCKGRKGILLPSYPKDYSELLQVFSKYLKINVEDFVIYFKDQDNDECEITDQETYEAALNEFGNKIVLNLISRDLVVPIGHSLCMDLSPTYLKFFKKKTRVMFLFDVVTEKMELFKLPQGIYFKEYAAWIDLPNGEIFYCGGGHPISSDEAYIINPQTKSFKKLPNMQYTRHSHGIAYLNGAVYVFGGIQNMLFYGAMTKKCERFILEENCWEEIGDLDSPRADVGACVHGNDIYILGKGSQSIVQYNSNDLNIFLGEDSGGSVVAHNSMLYSFHGSYVKICDLNTRRITEKVDLPGNKSWWSHMPPQVIGDFIYIIWWEEPGWVCKYNMKTKEFLKVLSFKNE